MIARRKRTVAGNVKPAANAGLTLYATLDSLPSDWARLVLAEKEVDSARVRLLRPGEFDEDLATLNPGQSMPTLADREGVLTGAAVIAEYLDERYPHPKLMPPAPAERARIRMALRHIEQEILPLTIEATTADRKSRGKLAAALHELVQTGARRYGSHGWYLGLEFNLVDCLIAVMLLRVQPAELASSPVLAQYAQRLAARPAFRACFEARVIKP